MIIEEQIDNNIPFKLIPKSIASESDYNYIRNNEVEYEWKCRNKGIGEKDESKIQR